MKRRLKGASTQKLAHGHQQFLMPGEEREIVRWVVWLDKFGFPSRVSYVKEAILLLKHLEFGLEEGTLEPYLAGAIGKDYVTSFLKGHPDLVFKLSSNLDKKRIKNSHPGVIQRNSTKVQGISNPVQVMCLSQERSMIVKIATDGTRQLLSVVETMDGEGVALSLLIIYKGVAHYIGWEKQFYF